MDSVLRCVLAVIKPLLKANWVTGVIICECFELSVFAVNSEDESSLKREQRKSYIGAASALAKLLNCVGTFPSCHG
jgi:hypothetical protein